MKISTLVKILLVAKKEKGNLEVFLSSDSEGNSYSTLGKKASDSIYWDKKKVILFPYEEGIEFDDEDEFEMRGLLEEIGFKVKD